MTNNRGKLVFKSVDRPISQRLKSNSGRRPKPGLPKDRDRRKRAAARKRVAYAVKTGKIDKPDRCEYLKCRTRKLDAHHVDYDDPLEVVWLCRRHHSALHLVLKT